MRVEPERVLQGYVSGNAQSSIGSNFVLAIYKYTTRP